MFEKYVMFEMQSVSPPGSQKGHVDSISLEHHPYAPTNLYPQLDF